MLYAICYMLLKDTVLKCNSLEAKQHYKMSNASLWVLVKDTVLMYKSQKDEHSRKMQITSQWIMLKDTNVVSTLASENAKQQPT